MKTLAETSVASQVALIKMWQWAWTDLMLVAELDLVFTQS